MARLFLLCNMGALGSEFHVKSAYPMAQAARAPYAHLLPLGYPMLMRHADCSHMRFRTL